MEPKVYNYQKKYVTVGGEVKYYNIEKKYVPKNAPGEGKQIRRKKEGSVYDITRAAQEFSDNERELLRVYIKELQNKQRTENITEEINR